MLVVFKAAPILKRTLKVRHALMQLYVLKLLKMQTKYLGRQWRKTNMKIISAIYEKVRHRLNDDWAFGNGKCVRSLINSYKYNKMVKLDQFQDLDARPWDFQMEECTLRSCVDRFNNRRYLANQTFLNAKASVANPHVLNNTTANSNYQVSSNTTNMPNQIGYSSGNVGGISNGSIGNSNANNSMNTNGSQQV